jgi:hypothetical protein
MTLWREGFIEYDPEVGSGAMIYIPSFIKIGSDILKFTRGESQKTDNIVI